MLSRRSVLLSLTATILATPAFGSENGVYLHISNRLNHMLGWRAELDIMEEHEGEIPDFVTMEYTAASNALIQYCLDKIPFKDTPRFRIEVNDLLSGKTDLVEVTATDLERMDPSFVPVFVVYTLLEHCSEYWDHEPRAMRLFRSRYRLHLANEYRDV